MKRPYLLPGLALASAILAIIAILVQIGGRDSARPSSPGTSALFGPTESLILWLNLSGAIQNGPLPGEVDHIIGQLKWAEANPAIKAVLLGINSPGGPVATTKKLYERVRRFREKKPVVAVVGDIAASGGYYVASACNRIVAYESSLLGSIGVISIRLNVAQFLERYGINADTIKAGRYKDASYPFRDLLPEEREMYQRIMDDAYRSFLQDVSEGRERALRQVREWGEGRIYSGRQALRLEMIDALGGRDKGIELAKELLGQEEELRVIDPQEDFIEKIFRFFLTDPALQAKEDYERLFAAPFLYYYPSPSFMRQLLDFALLSGRLD